MARKNESGKELSISLSALIPGGRPGDRPIDYKKIKEKAVAKLKEVPKEKQAD